MAIRVVSSVACSSKCVFASIISILFLFLTLTMGDPRDHTIKVICGEELEHNTTAYVPNFFGSMEKVREQIRNSGFGTAGTGVGPDSSYGLAQCHRDLSSLDCVLCHSQARTMLPQCFPFNGGRAFIDGCFLRFENYSFFEEYKGPQDTAVCGNLTQNNSMFTQATREAVRRVAGVAPSNQGFATAQVAVAGMANESAYVLAQCWRSLNSSFCSLCLQNASASILRCLPRSEGRALNTGCFMRYSNTDFINKNTQNSKRGTRTEIVVSVLSSVVVLIIGVGIGAYIWKHRYIQKKRKGSTDVKKLVKTLQDSNLNFKYSTLEKATGNFNSDNKIGQGGFATVYKGVLSDGREIAIKRFFFNIKHRAADFYNEVNMISSVEHKNLVRLLGCSCSGPESLLVYEFLPNKSLDRFIFNIDNGKALDWDKRFNIIIGTVEGLVYLHENPKFKIIHRDIKASNILLDLKHRAKIADFGLAKSFQEDKSHISTAVAGTLGYMAPEYLAYGQLTEKADVYSFGVLLLEIVTGMPNHGMQTSENIESIVTNTWKHFQEGTVERLFDPNLNLENHYNKKIKHEVLRVVQMGLLCIQENPSLRPTMSKVLRMLTMEEEHLPLPTNPPFMDEMTMELSDSCRDSQYHFPTYNSSSTTTVTHSSFHPR